MKKLWLTLRQARREEKGAEMVEWTLWVALIATVCLALVTPVTTAVTTAIQTVLSTLPTAT